MKLRTLLTIILLCACTIVLYAQEDNKRTVRRSNRVRRTKVEQKDREKVASVFYNRLEGINWDGPKFLQSDPTTFYPYGDGKYNTYKTEGIPVGPLCAPSIECIKAAIDPDRSCKAVYFVTDKSMKFYYNETLSGHNKTVAELKRTGNWVYSTLGS